MKKLFFGALAAAALAAPALAADLSTPVQTINFGTHQTEFDPNSPTQGYATQNFQLFDSSLGTLTGVVFQMTYQENSAITITNNASVASNGYAYSNSSFTLSGSDENIATAFGNVMSTVYAYGNIACFTSGASCVVPGFGTVAKTNNAIAKNGGQLSFNSNSTVVDSGEVTINPEDLQYFAAYGGGFSQLLASTATSAAYSGTGGLLNAQQTTTGTPTVTMYYTYSVAAVPEPATWAMMIIGFGAVGYAMRRKGVAVAFN